MPSKDKETKETSLTHRTQRSCPPSPPGPLATPLISLKKCSEHICPPLLELPAAQGTLAPPRGGQGRSRSCVVAGVVQRRDGLRLEPTVVRVGIQILMGRRSVVRSYIAVVVPVVQVKNRSHDPAKRERRTWCAAKTRAWAKVGIQQHECRRGRGLRGQEGHRTGRMLTRPNRFHSLTPFLWMIQKTEARGQLWKLRANADGSKVLQVPCHNLHPFELAEICQSYSHK
ncbi:hypothetical protein GALMADRAFT_255388 [Galerina marginata CBS 339.88]|uniref:Uncharacterized protein n=1 Tax=Galerina marginata (strain CBS 339.88) TaxID=685588 RepID=A0A067SGK8_GALM3|nr:hypothetical protein GALMADRAFT_255388 [Galerina marginata CBS 339.88]